MRYILSIIILTLIITYLIIPLIPTGRKIVKKEGKRIEKSFNSKSNNKKDGNSKWQEKV